MSELLERRKIHTSFNTSSDLEAMSATESSIQGVGESVSYDTENHSSSMSSSSLSYSNIGNSILKEADKVFSNVEAMRTLLQQELNAVVMEDPIHILKGISQQSNASNGSNISREHERQETDLSKKVLDKEMMDNESKKEEKIEGFQIEEMEEFSFDIGSSGPVSLSEGASADVSSNGS